ncbi:MAG: DNA polymerase III subunit epsilon [Hyphomicrobiales bacterium]|nr:DNA polymerase III subunit epsilon [Hyphomicrobiales bacterium]
MREIVLDTETTGLDPATGDRVVEIGAVELVNGVVTGANFHVYVNPERDMPEAAFRVHGLSEEFLRKHPVFAQVAEEFVAFIGDDRLVIHNAEFDVKFLNAELARLTLPPLDPARVLDSLMLARRKHPGAANSLDALCGRYGVDVSRRKKHGALLDAELLAEVYIELSGGRQSAFALQAVEVVVERAVIRDAMEERPAALPPRLSADEIAAHAKFIEKLGEKAFWRKTQVYGSGGRA